MTWILYKQLMMGGTTDLGFTSDSKYLLVISHNGRGLFDVQSGERVARDYEPIGPWHRNTEADGIGLSQDQVIPIFGIHAKLPDYIKQELKDFDLENHITEFKGAVISPDESCFAIGYSDEIELYKKA